MLLVLGALLFAHASGYATFPEHLTGDVSAVYDLVERVIPTASSHFNFALAQGCAGIPQGNACFVITDEPNGTLSISASSASELTGGLGVYLREYCGMTIGWERGGGRHVFLPERWPKVGQPFVRARSVPYSHVTQVCTHSYTLVWYDWPRWEQFIDWMALSGHNSIIAPTGQEEVQYKVFTEQFGITDMDVRNWTNGPAFLTWSRGQNSHGNSIAGPLPRSFMKGQWSLQKQILARYRDLGILGHLPAFGGFTPWAIAVAQNDTQKGGATRGSKNAYDTAWIDGRDPLFTKIADAWMKQVLEDFGSDHAWQMDAFFSNGTGWGAVEDDAGNATCTWSSASPNTYIKGCASSGIDSDVREDQCPYFETLDEAKDSCISSKYPNCMGVTLQRNQYQLRAGNSLIPVGINFNETSWLIANITCKWDLPPDPVYLARAKAAYSAIARADGPSARWIFQGWAIHAPGSGMSPPTPAHLSALHGFSEAAPPGKFIVMDMSAAGQWRDPWQGKWGFPFIWTALPDFGGDLGLKGNLSEINEIPWAAPPLSPGLPEYNAATQAVGVGYTPEGLDQNPAYYELLQEAAFKTEREANLTDWLIKRAHRRYGIKDAINSQIASAWAYLGSSVYSNDAPVHDTSGVGTMPARGWPDWAGFEPGNEQPKPAVCALWYAWGDLIAAAPAVISPTPETYTYDLVDVGRETLAQLTIPLSINFSHALMMGKLNKGLVNKTGSRYLEVLLDLESLLSTDKEFLLGPWLESARNLGGNATDCNHTAIGNLNCQDFMEWNARAQLTTWKPTTSPEELSAGPLDYARKQWAGLVGDYYAKRLELYIGQAIKDAEAGERFNQDTMDKKLARFAYDWQTDLGPNKYPTTTSGDAIEVSTALQTKYASYFRNC